MNARIVKLIGILLFTINLGWPALSSAGPSDQGTWGRPAASQIKKQSAEETRCEKQYLSSDMNPKGLRAWNLPQDCPKSASPSKKQSADETRCEKGYLSAHLNPKGLRAWTLPQDCPESASPCPNGKDSYGRIGPHPAKGIPFSAQDRHC